MLTLWPAAFARYRAKKLLKRRKVRESIRWHERLGVRRMSRDERVDYAGLLHESGQSDRAADLLTDLLRTKPEARAYERRAHVYNEIGREDEAIADLDEAIALDPMPYLYWYTRAISRNNRGEYDLAAADFLEAIRRREDSTASTYYELGNVYMKSGKYADAELSYRSAAADGTTAIPHYYFRLAQALEQAERADEALLEIGKAIELQRAWSAREDKGVDDYRNRTRYSPAAIATFVRGADEEFGFRLYASKLHEAQGDLASALDLAEEALSSYPGTAELLLRRGSLLRRLNRAAEAASALEELKSGHPQWLPVYLELSAAYRADGKPEEAVRVLSEAKERYPDHPVVRFWLTDAYRDAGQGERARKENGQLIEIEPDDPLNWKQKAELLVDGENFREAEAAYTEALRLEESAETYMRRSYSRYMQDRFEEALLDVQAAARLDGDLLKDGKTAYALGELYMGMGNRELADMEYSRAIATEPDNPQLYERRARCRYAAERWDEALADCNRTMQLSGPHPRLTWLRGLIRYRQDDLEGALRDIRSYSEQVPDDPQSHFNLGRLYNQLDRYEEAEAAFSKALELNPFDAQAYFERASLWYHHYFDRGRASNDLAQWLLYAKPEAAEEDRFAMLGEARGFDDELRELAKEQYLKEIGHSRYLS